MASSFSWAAVRWSEAIETDMHWRNRYLPERRRRGNADLSVRLHTIGVRSDNEGRSSYGAHRVQSVAIAYQLAPRECAAWRRLRSRSTEISSPDARVAMTASTSHGGSPLGRVTLDQLPDDCRRGPCSTVRDDPHGLDSVNSPRAPGPPAVQLPAKAVHGASGFRNGAVVGHAA